jgi:type II secretory pathway pseudopilin PulG
MRRKKRTLTLLEIIIVIFLITLITGAIGYNMKGTLEKGKAFRTEQAKAQLRDLLLTCVAEGYTYQQVLEDPKKYLKESDLAKNPDKLVIDGWGEPFSIVFDKSKGDFRVRSKNLDNYNAKKKKVAEEEAESDL